MGSFPEKAASAYTKSRRKGFLFEEDSNAWQYNGIRNSGPFFEMLFLAAEGTTKAYRRDEEGAVHPVFGEQENMGEISVTIQSMQDAGIQFVKDLYRSASKELLIMDAEVSACNYQALARVPSLSTLALFDKFKAYDERIYRFVSERSLGWYLLHPKRFVRDFAEQPGKSWFLKSVFKIPLPYISILNLERKITGVK